MCSWLNLSLIWGSGQLCAGWEMTAVCTCEEVCSPLRNGYFASAFCRTPSVPRICAFMSLWSKVEITATAPICFHAWQLHPLTFSGTFASHDWFMATVKPVKGGGGAQIFILLKGMRSEVLILLLFIIFLIRKSGLHVQVFTRLLAHMQKVFD